MSDTETVETTGVETDAAPDADGSPDPRTEEYPPGPGREAAKYRTQLRAAEAERDALSAHLEILQVREVERLAAELAQPADLLELSGKQLSDFTTPEGFVDSDAVSDAVADLLTRRPGLARNLKQMAVDRSQGQGGSGRSQPEWADLFRA